MKLGSVPELHLDQAFDLIGTTKDPKTRHEALLYLRTQALEDQTSTAAKIKLSVLYAEGKPFVDGDATEAALWSRSVFDKQLAQALSACAYAAKSRDTVVEYVLEVQDTIDPYACYMRGLILSKGIGLKSSLEEGVEALKQSAESGVAKVASEAAYELGRIYGDRYTYSLHDIEASLSWFQRAADLGKVEAVVDLAYGYHVLAGDRGLPEEERRVLALARHGAEQLGDKHCQYILGHIQRKQRATEREAIRWLTAASDQGVAAATEELVAVHLRYREYGQAFTVCIDHPMLSYCQATLGDMYRQGLSVSKDAQKAVEYYKKAVSITQPEAHHYHAQHMLGEMYLHGEGIPQDLAAARDWFQVAASQGYEPSRQKLLRLASTPATTPIPTSSPTASTMLSSPTSTRSSFDEAGGSPIPGKKPSRWSLGFFGRKKV